MAHALRISISDRGHTASQTFRQFPVRIGRDETFECRLEYPFVSRTHARIDVYDGTVWLHDEGSTSGTFIDGRHERIREPVNLARVGWSFRIGALVVTAELIDEGAGPTMPEAQRRGRGHVEHATTTYGHRGIDPGRLDADAVRELARESCRAHRETLRAHVKALVQAIESPEDRVELMDELEQRFPELHESATHDSNRTIVEGLVHRLLPQRPLSSLDVAAFATRLSTAIETLAGGVCALAYVYDGEASQAQAPQPRALLEQLVDPAAGGYDLDSLFAKLATHHAMLVREVENNVLTLLEELSPAGVEAAVSGVFRQRSAWRELERRHGTFTRAGVRSLLGPTFAQAARALAPAELDETHWFTGPPPAVRTVRAASL